MTQTAIEWLIDELTKTQFLWLSDKPEMNELIEIIKQAKEMEKQQIIDAFKRGLINEMNGIEEITSKQYYNQRFKNK